MRINLKTTLSPTLGNSISGSYSVAHLTLIYFFRLPATCSALQQLWWVVVTLLVTTLLRLQLKLVELTLVQMVVLGHTSSISLLTMLRN